MDTLLTLRFASALTVSTDEQQLAADVSGERKVISIEVLTILRFSASLSTNSTCGESVEYVA